MVCSPVGVNQELPPVSPALGTIAAKWAALWVLVSLNSPGWMDGWMGALTVCFPNAFANSHDQT